MIDRFCDLLGRLTPPAAFAGGVSFGACLALVVALLALVPMALIDARPTTVGVAATAAGIALVTLVARLYFDVRATWWTRAEWAIDKVLSEDPPSVSVGYAAVQQLAHMRTTSRQDKALFAAAVQVATDAWLNSEVDLADEGTHDGQ